MKITGSHVPVGELGNGTSVSSALASPSSTAAADAAADIDRVTTDQSNDLRSAVASGVALATTERAVRLHSLAQAVSSGTYRPNASHLAEQILARADLDARLAVALSRQG